MLGILNVLLRAVGACPVRAYSYCVSSSTLLPLACEVHVVLALTRFEDTMSSSRAEPPLCMCKNRNRWSDWCLRCLIDLDAFVLHNKSHWLLEGWSDWTDHSVDSFPFGPDSLVRIARPQPPRRYRPTSWSIHPFVRAFAADQAGSEEISFHHLATLGSEPSTRPGAAPPWMR